MRRSHLAHALSQALIAVYDHAMDSREFISRPMKGLETGGYLAMRERRIVLVKKLPERW